MSNPRRVRYASRATRQLRALLRMDYVRVERAIQALALNGRGNVKRLHGDLAGEWRLRVGRLRVRYSTVGDEIVVLEVADRKDIYR